MIRAGDKLYVTQGFRTLAGVEYARGDILELIEPTGQSPHDNLSPLGNWIVKCKHWSPPAKESVWSGIWMLIEYGMLSRERVK